MKIDQQQKQLAWQNAFEMRACPSDGVLFSYDNSPELKAHISFCKICQEKINTTQEDKKIWEKLAEKLTMKFAPQTTDSTPKPGQVWGLSHKLSGWGPSNLYYKAPNVLLLETIEGSENGFKVAQLFSSPELMGPNDVWLSERFGFVEIWNNYSIHKKDLECCWGVTTDSTFIKARAELQRLESGMENSNGIKDYAQEGSILYQFRNLESEVGSYFAMQSVSVLVDEYQRAAAWGNIPEKLREFVQNVKSHSSDLGAYIGELAKGWSFPTISPQLCSLKDEASADNYSLVNNLLSFFGQAVPPDEFGLAMAAASAGELLFPANYLKLTSSGVKLMHATVQLGPPSWDKRGLVIKGKVRDVSPNDLNAWWIVEGKDPIPALPISITEENEFRIVFEGLDKFQIDHLDKKLKLLLIGYE